MPKPLGALSEKEPVKGSLPDIEAKMADAVNANESQRIGNEAASAQAPIEHVHPDGTTRKAENVEDVHKKCPFLGKMALKDVELFIELSAIGNQKADDESSQAAKIKESESVLDIVESSKPDKKPEVVKNENSPSVVTESLSAVKSLDQQIANEEFYASQIAPKDIVQEAIIQDLNHKPELKVEAETYEEVKPVIFRKVEATLDSPKTTVASESIAEVISEIPSENFEEISQEAPTSDNPPVIRESLQANTTETQRARKKPSLDPVVKKIMPTKLLRKFKKPTEIIPKPKTQTLPGSVEDKKPVVQKSIKKSIITPVQPIVLNEISLPKDAPLKDEVVPTDTPESVIAENLIVKSPDDFVLKFEQPQVELSAEVENLDEPPVYDQVHDAEDAWSKPFALKFNDSCSEAAPEVQTEVSAVIEEIFNDLQSVSDTPKEFEQINIEELNNIIQEKVEGLFTRLNIDHQPEDIAKFVEFLKANKINNFDNLKKITESIVAEDGTHEPGRGFTGILKTFIAEANNDVQWLVGALALLKVKTEETV